MTLNKRHETFKKMLKEKTQLYETLKARLDENETYAQVRSQSHISSHDQFSPPFKFVLISFQYRIDGAEHQSSLIVKF